MEQCFGLTLLSSNYVGYFFNSFNQIRYTAPSQNCRLREIVQELAGREPELQDSTDFSYVSHILERSLEEITDSLLKIRNDHPVVFELLAPELIKPVELVAVFRKE